MLIRVASDLHLEFFGNPVEVLAGHFLPADARDGGAVLVLAGDISAKPDQLLAFLRLVEQRFGAVIYVPGNHEYYRHQLAGWNANARQWARTLARTTAAIDRVTVTDVDGVRFIACTLWADGGLTKGDQRKVGDYLADFKVIGMGARKFTVNDMQALHRKHRDGIVEALGRSDGRAVVVTHHLPSYRLCHPRFGSECNGGFASSCDALMEDASAPALWIHGHTHDTMDTTVARTRVVCNPAGYQPEWGTPFNTFLAAPKFIEFNATQTRDQV